VGVGRPPSSFPLGGRGGNGSLWDSWGCLRGISFFRYGFTNFGQGLSTSLTLFHSWGMFCKEKEQL
jgi:hypothetical protein